MSSQESRRYLLLGFGAVAVFAGCVLFRNIYLWQHYCWSNYDLGIFIEMIQKNAQGILNPYINVRQIGQFNDHFTAIVTLLSPLNSLISNPYLLFLIEVGFITSTVGVLFYEYKIGVATAAQFALFSTFIFLNRDMFEAGYFAVHPAAWGVLFLTMLSFKSIEIRAGHIPISFKNLFVLSAIYVVLCLFDEQFSIAGVGFALGLLIINKDKRVGVFFLILALTMYWVAHSGRRMMFGPLMPYYKLRMATGAAEFLSRYAFTFESWRTLFSHLLGLLPFFILMKGEWRRQMKRHWRPVILLCGLFGPMILGRLLSNSFGFHYSTVVVIFWASLFFLLIPKERLTKKAVFFSCVFFAVLSISKSKKAFTTPLFQDGMNCLRRGYGSERLVQRQQRLDQAFEFLHKQEGDQSFRIISLPNLGPNLLVRFPKAEVFNLGVYHITNIDEIGWFMSEYGDSGEIIYTPPEVLQRVIEKIKMSPGAEVLIEADGVFLARGRFPAQMFDEFSTVQATHE